MSATQPNWVERRAALRADLPVFWGRLCVDLEDAARAFDQIYAFNQGLSVDIYRKGDCLHIDCTPREPSIANALPARSVDICFDRIAYRVVVRVNGEIKKQFQISANQDGKAQVVDGENQILSNDQLSELLLEEFFFPGSSR